MAWCCRDVAGYDRHAVARLGVGRYSDNMAPQIGEVLCVGRIAADTVRHRDCSASGCLAHQLWTGLPSWGLRQSLGHLRWPEMVTHDQLNKPNSLAAVAAVKCYKALIA